MLSPELQRDVDPPTLALDPLSRTCTFCWAALPLGAVMCDDCGSTVADMEVARARQAETDRKWIPPSQCREESTPVRPIASAPIPLRVPAAWKAGKRDLPAPHVPDPLPGVTLHIHGRWKALAAALAAGALLCALLVSGVWIGVSVISGGARDKSPAAGAGKANKPGGSTAANPGRTGVRWPQLPDGVRAALVNSRGKVVADAESGNRNVESGAYTVRFRSPDGRWERRTGAVTLAPGASFSPTLPPAMAADYYLWQGKRRYAAGREREAEAAWLAALRLRPELVEARVQLAAALAVHYRYKEAREQVDAALRYAPGDRRARRLDAVLDRLESNR